ncbi:MAG: hypothetical protein ACRDJ9_04900, partial [Dehalococcoidia bacterium]
MYAGAESDRCAGIGGSAGHGDGTTINASADVDAATGYADYPATGSAHVSDAGAERVTASGNAGTVAYTGTNSDTTNSDTANSDTTNSDTTNSDTANSDTANRGTGHGDAAIARPSAGNGIARSAVRDTARSG